MSMSEPVHDLSALASVWAQSASEDLSGLVAKELKLSAGEIEEGDRDAMLGRSGSLVYTACTTQDTAAKPLGFAMSLGAAQMLATVKLGKGPDELAALAESGLEGEVAAAHSEVMDLCVGILGRVFAEEASLPSLQLGASNCFEAGAPGDLLSAGPYRRVAFELAISDFAKERIDLLLPAASATAWFGNFARSAPAPGEDVPDGPIAVLDPSEECREAFSAIAAKLEREAKSIDPEELSEASIDELSDVAALVLEWDLGGKSGLDLLERLRADPRTASLRIAMAADKPTRSMLEAALRWGANSFLCKPYEVGEIATRLLNLEGPPESES